MNQDSSRLHFPLDPPATTRISAAVVTAFLICISFAMGAPELTSISHPAKVIRFERFEATFQVGSTVADNLQWPFDPSPPNGIPAATGISVDGLFTPDNWTTVYVQPGFLHESFADEVRDGKPWYYPTGQYRWKVRFAPNRAGTWAFRLRARDAGGTVESTIRTFEVSESSSPGFVRVSRSDPRYFEFDNGAPFLGLGYQATTNLTEADFQKMAANGIQFLRMWWTPESIFGSQWNPYYEIRNQYLGYVPRPGVLPFEDEVEGKTSIKMRLDYKPDGNTSWFDACRVIGYWGTPTEVKPKTTYRVAVRYRGFGISGPRDAGHPDFGLVVKTDVAWQNDGRAFDAGTGSAVTGYGRNTPSSWGTITGRWYSGTNNFLPKFFVTLENVLAGQAYVDSVSMREELGGGQLGPEILHKPSMEHQNYFQQRNSYHLDRLVEMAGRYGVYLKVVILEKGEVISKKIDFDGNFAQDNDAFFFGRGREVGKVRWLQQAWWRYLQARWGYSTSIHSWELLNEGDPYSDQHYTLTDEFGKFMHCRVFGRSVGTGEGDKCTYDHPNDHLVTTSFWHSLPAKQVWENPRYPNIDYVDVHAYVSTGWIRDAALESDAAEYHLAYSNASRGLVDSAAAAAQLPGKPIVRGEAGLDLLSEQKENPDLSQDRQGVWLHNFLWSSLDPGALYELYWWSENRENQPGPDGVKGLHEIYRGFSDFLAGLPLNNGRYRDLAATTSTAELRVVGQKAPGDGRAHLWVQNRTHTWKRAVSGAPIPAASGTVVIGGFAAGSSFTLEEWDPYRVSDPAGPIAESVLTSDADGRLSIEVQNLMTDVAFKLVPKQNSGGPSEPERPRNLRVVQDN